MTYLITGGAGFIGSHLADALLAQGHKVRVLDDFSTGKMENLDDRCDVVRGDARDLSAVRRAMSGTDGCFHLAAIASVARGNEDWVGTHGVNQGATVTVLDTARTLGGLPVVYASSAAVYGSLEGTAREDTMPAPRTAYGVDKLGSELHARVGAHVHGVPSVGFRFFNVYGPRQDPASPYSGVISIFADAIGAGRPITLHGDGRQTRDFVYVRDVVAHLVAGMRYCSETRGAHVLNVCTGQETVNRRPCPHDRRDQRSHPGHPARAAAGRGHRPVRWIPGACAGGAGRPRRDLVAGRAAGHVRGPGGPAGGRRRLTGRITTRRATRVFTRRRAGW